MNNAQNHPRHHRVKRPHVRHAHRRTTAAGPTPNVPHTNFIAKLKEGGQAFVYVAFYLGLLGILKLSKPGHGGARLHRGAALFAELNHPNIVPITNYGQLKDGRTWIFEPHVGDRDLRALTKQPQPLILVLNVAAALARAIEAFTRHGIVHRDIKPENIRVLLDEDGHLEGLWVIDSGLAKRMDDVSGLTSVDEDAFGTPGYMPPEQVTRSEPYNGQLDVFSASVVLYELVTGEHPFEASSPPCFHVLMELDGLLNWPDDTPEDVKQFIQQGMLLERESRLNPTEFRQRAEQLQRRYDPENAKTIFDGLRVSVENAKPNTARPTVDSRFAWLGLATFAGVGWLALFFLAFGFWYVGAHSAHNHTNPVDGPIQAASPACYPSCADDAHSSPEVLVEKPNYSDGASVLVDVAEEPEVVAEDPGLVGPDPEPASASGDPSTPNTAPSSGGEDRKGKSGGADKKGNDKTPRKQGYIKLMMKPAALHAWLNGKKLPSKSGYRGKHKLPIGRHFVSIGNDTGMIKTCAIRVKANVSTTYTFTDYKKCLKGNRR